MSSSSSRRYQFRLLHLFVVMTVAALLLGWFAVPEPPEPPKVTVEKYAYGPPIDKEYLQYTLRVGDTREVFYDRAPFGSLDAWESSHGSRVTWNWWPGTWNDFVEPIPEKAFITFNSVRSAVAGAVDIRTMDCFRFTTCSTDRSRSITGGLHDGAVVADFTDRGVTWVGSSPDSSNWQVVVDLPRDFTATADSPKSFASLRVRPTAYVARELYVDEEERIIVVVYDANRNRVRYSDSAPFGNPDDVTVEPYGKSWKHALSYHKPQNGAAPWERVTDDMYSQYEKLISAAAQEVLGKSQQPSTPDKLLEGLSNGLQWMIDLEKYSIEPLALEELYCDLDAAPQIVSISCWPETMFEGDPFPTNLYLSRHDSPKHRPLSVFLNVAGSATPDVDYRTPSTWFTIPAGESSVEVALEPLRDSLAEGNESIIVELASNDDYDVDPENASVQLLLIDGENPITLGIHLDKVTVDDEGEHWAEVIVRRSGPVEYRVCPVINARTNNCSSTVPVEIFAGRATASHRFYLDWFWEGGAKEISVRLLHGNYRIDPDAGQITVPFSKTL